MGSDPAAAARKASSDARGSVGPAGRRVLPCAALAACAALVLVVGGCGPSRLRPIASEWEFNQEVLKSDRPVVVYFSKGGCAWCMFLDSCMDQLYEEYRDRVTFTRFELMTFWSKITCEPIWKRYRIARFPTVVLFVNGKEKYRWVTNYSGDAYRPVLDEVAGPPAPRRTPAASGGPPA
jgi:thiol-disulfide isomerase/thioredoxin